MLFMLVGYLTMELKLRCLKLIRVDKKGLLIRRNKTTKSRTGQKVIWRQLVCKKEGHQKHDRRLADKMYYFHEIHDVTVQQELK